jgi:glycosyltransferase involved in cell wall biosynthesis
LFGILRSRTTSAWKTIKDKIEPIIYDTNITNLTFLGYVADEIICQYYFYTDLVILPSEYAEGFGLPLIEAYYFNKPVIASNGCAIPEIIISKDFLFENTPISIWQTLCKSRSLFFDFKKFYDTNYSNTVIFNEYRKLYDEVDGFKLYLRRSRKTG